MVSRRILIASLFVVFFCGLAFFYSGTNRGGLLEPDISPRPAYAAPSTTFKIYLPLILKNSGPTNPLWRFGVARARRPFTDYVPADIAAMRFGWYVDFGTTSNAPQPYGIQYVPTVRVKQWKVLSSNPVTWTSGGCVTCTYAMPYTYTVSPGLSQIAAMASARPGTLWLIGNEIERVDWDWNGYQDEILPEVYAVAYRDIYNAIKSADPSAQVAIGAVIQATPLRLKYLTRVWDSYFQTYSQTMPVDVWNVHAYVLQEKSCQYYPDSECYGAEVPAGLTETAGMAYTIPDNKNFSLVAQQINALRAWMQARGQQSKPLIITEAGVLYSDWLCDPSGFYCYPGTFSPTQVRDSMMYPAFDYFLNHTDVSLGYPADGNRLVQRWNWYSHDDDSGGSNQNFNGTLFYSGLSSNPQGIAPLGTYWKQYVQPLPAGSIMGSQKVRMRSR